MAVLSCAVVLRYALLCVVVLRITLDVLICRSFVCDPVHNVISRPALSGRQ